MELLLDLYFLDNLGLMVTLTHGRNKFNMDKQELKDKINKLMHLCETEQNVYKQEIYIQQLKDILFDLTNEKDVEGLIIYTECMREGTKRSDEMIKKSINKMN